MLVPCQSIVTCIFDEKRLWGEVSVRPIAVDAVLGVSILFTLGRILERRRGSRTFGAHLAAAAGTSIVSIGL